MGTSYGLYNGRWVLDCGECGRVGGVRRRRCPARGPTGTPYCPPSQLCATCYATWRRDGRWAAAHATCQRDSNAYHAREAAKNAEPHRWAASAQGDWAAGVPAGMVRVVTRAGTEVYVLKEDYRPDQPLPIV